MRRGGAEKGCTPSCLSECLSLHTSHGNEIRETPAQTCLHVDADLGGRKADARRCAHLRNHVCHDLDQLATSHHVLRHSPRRLQSRCSLILSKCVGPDNECNKQDSLYEYLTFPRRWPNGPPNSAFHLSENEAVAHVHDGGRHVFEVVVVPVCCWPQPPASASQLPHLLPLSHSPGRQTAAAWLCSGGRLRYRGSRMGPGGYARRLQSAGSQQGV